MAILAYSPEHDTVCEILDVYTCGGVELASVKAISGKPFVGGDRWPIRTEYSILKTAELMPVVSYDLADPAELATQPAEVQS